MDTPTIIVAFEWFDQRIFKGIGSFCIEHNWHLAPYFFSDRLLPRNWPADGAITCLGKSLNDFIYKLDMPKVDVSFCESKTPIPRVTVDNAQIGKLAAEHFLNRGYKKFAYFSWKVVEVNQLRKTAFFDALRAAGVPEESLFVIEQPGHKVLSDWPREMRQIMGQLNQIPRPLAVFTGQDNLGVELIEICRYSGISVPEEIAVLGVDNIGLQCECASVPLSSVDTHMEELGYAAADQLRLLIEGKISINEPVRTVRVGPVVTRLSTDALAVDHPKVIEALTYMKSNFGDGLVIQQVLSRVGMSKRGLEKAFKSKLGRSPATELRRIRIEHAKKLLLQTDMKIESIANECGYSSASNLSHALRKELNMSPNEYRKAFTTPKTA